MYMKEVSTSNFLFLIACCIELLPLHIFITQLSNIKEVSSRNVMFFIACCIEPILSLHICITDTIVKYQGCKYE